MSFEASVLAERKVPRYTSYPTAPHFSAEIDAETYAAWLAALAPGATLSLYLHVPFCAKLCHYCGCHTKEVRRDAPIAAYAELLAQEIALVAAQAGSRDVVHVHWGGGTPSILGAERFRALTAVLKDAFAFAPAHEHAIELDPRLVTPELVDALAASGVNRASLGVQDFSSHVQQAIDRLQTFECVETAVRRLRGAGIDRISIDLMYGLPLQTVADVQRTVAATLALRPQRLSVFGYAHVPWFKPHQRLIDDRVLPGPAERIEQADAVRAMLEAAGYRAIGLDHFALPDDPLVAAADGGTLRRNFQGYTDDPADALIGFGASAIGRMPQGFVQNSPDVGGYGRAIRGGGLATVKGVAFSADDHMRGRIIERLMCDLRVDLAAVAREARFDRELDALKPLETEGLVAVDGDRVTVTLKGRPFTRLMAAAFDAYLPAGAARHSVSV